ncbi:uncharacterized protein LOC116917845 [Daphnia magna]|uniref:uncharacterized protein LOC116917845 n=1 Tax=Daphnia magna TaxID=35525 RepID=UPI0006E9A0A6|nr:uncharacterized protein LOC116917845 [Daphnia magna]
MSLSSLISLFSYYWWPQPSTGIKRKKPRLSAKQQDGSNGMIKNAFNYPQNNNIRDFNIINMSLNDEILPTPDICGNPFPTGMELYPPTPPPDIYTTGDLFPNIPQQIFLSQHDNFNGPAPPQSYPSESNPFLSSQSPDGLVSAHRTHHQLQLLERRLANLEMDNTHLRHQLSETTTEIRELRQAFKISQDRLKKLVETLQGKGAGNDNEAGTEHCEENDNYLISFTPEEKMADEKTPKAEVPQVGLMGNYDLHRPRQSYPVTCQDVLPARENTTGSFQYLEPNKELEDAIPPTIWPDLSTLGSDNWFAMPLPNAVNLPSPQPAYNAYGSYGCHSNHSTDRERISP